MSLFVNPAVFAFLPLLTFVFAVLNYKKLKDNFLISILVISAFLLGLKSFFGLATLNYGAFFISFYLIAFLALIFYIFKDSKNNGFSIGLYLIIISVFLGFLNYDFLKEKNMPIKTSRGDIYTDKYFFKATNELLNYIEKNTKPTDKIAVYPEGLLLNFLSNRQSSKYYYSLIPLYIEVFGEETLLEAFKKDEPDYVVFSNWDSSNYYFKYICRDYALSLCGYIEKNYEPKSIMGDVFKYSIYKKK
ncbi:hypothetical protein SDC9_139806 [bioreactor metagenome]|uniref:Uncharacterized protein n=1 Tax=bioreactor metagenome TaxID=1076179 RepID=A0A645DTM0_9ZZZZ